MCVSNLFKNKIKLSHYSFLITELLHNDDERLATIFNILSACNVSRKVLFHIYISGRYSPVKLTSQSALVNYLNITNNKQK